MALSIPRPSFAGVKRSFASDTSLIVWVMVFQNLMRIVSSMTLTRLLTAADFAVAGVITSVLVTFALVSDIGIAAFIVRHEKTHEQRFRDEVWTLRLIRGIILSILMVVLAGPVASAMGKPELRWPIAVAGLSETLSALGSLAPIAALRSRRLRRITLVDIITQIIGLGISIGLAAWLRSYWAIILSSLIGHIMGVIFTYVLYEDSHQRWRFSRERSRELWQFSKFITGSTILTLVISQSDKLILSRLMSLETLGLYVIAGGLAVAPIGLVGAYAGKVFFPLLAEIRREAPETLAYRFYHDRWLATLAFAFAAGGLIGFAPALIPILYDPRYDGAGVYLQIMAISSFFAMGNYAANEVMIALGHSRFTFTTNIIRLTYLFAVGTAGWFVMGPMGIVWAVGTVEIAAQLFGWYTLRRHALLDIRREAVILLTGAGGLAVGYAAEIVARGVLHIR